MPFTYDSFGNVIASTPGATVDTRYKFTGREFDDETGMYYYRARYYDAGVGRFTSQDPLEFEGGSTNLYTYATNRPVDIVDPLGLYGGLVGAPQRRITYRITDNTGTQRDVTVNNINRVSRARLNDPNLYIISDVTTARIQYSPTRVGTEPTFNRNLIPDIQNGDDRGHIIGAQLGGSGSDLNNFFGHNAVSNRAIWQTYESRVTRTLDNYHRNQNPRCPSPPIVLDYRVELNYPRTGTTLRPGGFVAIVGTAEFKLLGSSATINRVWDFAPN